MSTKTDTLHEKVAADFIKLLEESTDNGAWTKPWVAAFSTAWPTNAKTGKRYQGGNAFYFWLLQTTDERRSNRWATYRQWQDLGGQVQKGEKGVQGIKWVISFKCETEGGKPRPAPCGTAGHNVKKLVFPSVFTVFNQDQTDLADETPAVPSVVDSPADAVQALVDASGANVTYKAGDSAHYVPGTVNITMPLPEQFTSEAGLHATLLHELVHYTGDKARLGRDQKNPFGSEAYAAEELVAEFGSVMVQASLGLAIEPSENSVKYVKSWVRVLKADPQNFFRAASLAQKAANWLLDKAAVEDTGEEVEAA